MSNKKKEGQQASAAEEDFAAGHEEPRTGVRLNLKSVAEAMCDVHRQAEDAFMAFVPPEVTQHLVNSRKELIRAGQRLGEKMVEELDDKARRAREIHDRMKAEKAGREASQA